MLRIYKQVGLAVCRAVDIPVQPARAHLLAAPHSARLQLTSYSVQPRLAGTRVGVLIYFDFHTVPGTYYNLQYIINLSEPQALLNQQFFLATFNVLEAKIKILRHRSTCDVLM